MNTESNKQDYFLGVAPFVSLKKFDGVILNYSRQLQRIEETLLNYYKFSKKDCLSELSKIKKELDQLGHQDQYIRVTFNNKGDFSFAVDSTDETFETCSKRTISVDLVKRELHQESFPLIKKINYQDVFEIVNEFKEKGYDDIIFYNSEDVVTEASTSNLLCLKNGEYFTPQRSDEFHIGTTIRFFIEKLNAKEKKVFKDDLDKLDGLWLLNARRGIRGVSKIQNKEIKIDPIETQKLIDMFLMENKN